MSRETLCCVLQMLSLGMDPLFSVCQKAKIWSLCMVEPVLKSFIKFLIDHPLLDCVTLCYYKFTVTVPFAGVFSIRGLA